MTKAGSPEPASETPPSDLASRLLAEAVRLHEEAMGAPLHEPHADARGRTAAGDLERRIIVRAGASSPSPALRTAFASLRTAMQIAFAAGLVAALLAGTGAARLVLGAYDEGPVNFFLALASLLGLHTVMLLVWLVFVLFHPGGAAVGLFGNLVLRLARRIALWLDHGPLEVAALRAAGVALANPRLGRWTLSTISHSMWMAYLAGCLGTVLLLLGTRQYDFVWETTILSERAYVVIARMLAAPVEFLGFPVPDAAQITGSRWTRPGELFSGRERWGGLLVGCLVVYGALPRALALLVSLAALLRARTAYRLDTSRPGFARLQGRLVSLAQPVGVVDADEPAEPETDNAERGATAAISGSGPVAILGLEIEPPGSGWPPAIAGIDWWELGFAEDRATRHHIARVLAAAEVPPRAVVVACSLATTPDRGTGAFLASLVQASPAPVVLVATDGERLRQRAPRGEVEQRIADWRALASHAGIAAELVLDLDLEHLTADSRQRLSRLLDGRPPMASVPAAQRLAQAFDLIATHADSWRSEPDMAQRAELQRAIARLWEADGGGADWRRLLDVRPTDLSHPVQSLKTAASRMVDLLPARLRLDPRWLAAGAAGGALACIAAAAVVAPVAITALPAWAGLGAALSALLPKREKPADAAATATPPDLGPAVDAAALFAMLLALQGREETVIGRVLDAAAGTEVHPAPLNDPAAVRNRLAGMQARCLAALAAEEAGAWPVTQR